jgi:hypothetical protein
VLGDIDDLVGKHKVKYQPKENRADLSPVKSIMNAIDALDSHIKGTRSVYEMLSDFAHPNVGPFLCFISKGKLKRDDKGVYWVEKTLSVGAPLGTIQEFGSVLSLIFITINKSLEHFEKLLHSCDKQRNTILQITQAVVRPILRNRKHLVSPYSLCPCGSLVKVKFCCGKK